MANANLQLLGNAIRTFREQVPPNGLSQFRLALLMNWEGTAPIVEIEKGRRLPRPETLNALGEALQLSPADIAYLHGLAGYREVTVMPSLEQIKRVLQAIEPSVAQRIYPAYVMDYQFRFWIINGAAAALQPQLLDAAIRQGVDGIIMTFDSRLPFYQGPPNGEVQEREAIFRFKAYNIYRRHEPFYLTYPERMKERLLPQDFLRFEQCWNDVDVRMQDMFPLSPVFVRDVGVTALVFEVHIVEILHLNHLFFAAYYEPRDDSTGNRKRCEAYFTERNSAAKCVMKAWDVL